MIYDFFCDQMIEIEANCMVDMIVKDIIPALHRAMGDRGEAMCCL